MKKKRIVRFEVKDGVFPPLSKKAKAQLEALRNIRDEDIDFSDIPPLTEKFWKNAIPNPFYIGKNRKKS
jgi:hypothetical protein